MSRAWCLTTYEDEERLMASQLTPEEREELDLIRRRLFDIANDKAGNDSGNASIYLHEAANNINTAFQCFDKGNSPSEPPPAWAVRRAMGLDLLGI